MIVGYSKFEIWTLFCVIFMIFWHFSMIIRIDNNRNSSNLASKCYLNISTSISGGTSKHAKCDVFVYDNCSHTKLMLFMLNKIKNCSLGMSLSKTLFQNWMANDRLMNIINRKFIWCQPKECHEYLKFILKLLQQSIWWWSVGGILH